MRNQKFLQIRKPNQTGFSLIEILVAIAILVALTAIALPMILLSRKRGIEIRTRSDLALIGMALEAYRADFGDYPRFDDDNTFDGINLQRDRGARLLCRALLSPASAAIIGTGTTLGFDASKPIQQAPDGADGPGFRVRAGGAGKVWGPYLDASKFKLGNPAAPLDPTTKLPQWDSTTFKDATLLDQNGNSILYYPGFPQGVIKTNYVRGGVYSPPVGANAAVPPARFYYDLYDNNQYGSTDAGTFILYWEQAGFILGDRNKDGGIGVDEKPSATLPYLLWTAGSDGAFGFQGRDGSNNPFDPTTLPPNKLKTDDVTNFDIPSDLKK